MALLGYARVSTSHQKLTAQITELKSVGVRDDRIFTDMMSGATDEREGLQRLLARAEKGRHHHLYQNGPAWPQYRRYDPHC